MITLTLAAFLAGMPPQAPQLPQGPPMVEVIVKKEGCACGCNCDPDACFCHEGSRCSSKCNCEGSPATKKAIEAGKRWAAQQPQRRAVEPAAPRPVSVPVQVVPAWSGLSPLPVAVPLSYYQPSYQPYTPPPVPVPSYQYQPRAMPVMSGGGRSGGC